MAAHATAPSAAAATGAALGDGEAGLEDAGLERGIARLMPRAMLIAIAVLGVLWWMAAQPPPGPGWNDPNGPQGQPWPPGQGPMPPVPQQAPPPPAESSFCAGCASFNCGDCVTSIDCADCIDCGDCLSGIDCSVCSVAGSNAAFAPNGPGSVNEAQSVSGKGLPTGKGVRTCSVGGWRRLAGSSGLLLPLVVLMGWRRRLRGRAATLSRRSTSTP